MIRVYGKSIAAFLAAALVAISTTVAAGHVGPVEKVQLATAVASAVGVWLIPAAPQWPWAKTGVAALLAVLNGTTSLLATGHGLSTADYINLAIAALGVLAVHVAPAMSGAKLVSAPANPPAPDAPAAPVAVVAADKPAA